MPKPKNWQSRQIRAERAKNWIEIIKKLWLVDLVSKLQPHTSLPVENDIGLGHGLKPCRVGSVLDENYV